MPDDSTHGPDWLAQLDQAMSAVVDVAKIVARYYLALIAEGVPHVDAMTFALSYQSDLLSGSTARDSDGD